MTSDMHKTVVEVVVSDDPYADEPKPNDPRYQVDKERADEDYPTRLMYLQNYRENVYLRYYYLLSIAIRYFMRIAKPYENVDAKRSYRRRVFQTIAPREMSFDDWQGLLLVPDDQVDGAISHHLNLQPPRPSVGAKCEAEEVFFFYCLCEVPGYLQLFHDRSPIVHFRLRDDRVLRNLLFSDKLHNRVSVRRLLFAMLSGADVPKNLFGSLKVGGSKKRGDLLNVHTTKVTLHTVATYLRIWYNMSLPYSRDKQIRTETDQRNESLEDNEIENAPKSVSVSTQGL